VEQAVQIVGALLVLAAFTLSQWRVIDSRSSRYLVPNLVGSATLAVDAWLGGEWGFLLLEGVWALVSAAALGRERGRASGLFRYLQEVRERERRDSNPRPPA
jgi:hypothetical protein